MADKITLYTNEVRETAQTISTALTKAAQPGPVPLATGASPIDAAAAAVAGGVAGKVAASHADIAPRAADGLTKTQSAMTGAETQDEQNAQQIEAVPAGMTAGMQPAGVPGQWDPFDDDDDIIKEPIPVIPNEAGPGPGAGPRIPDSVIRPVDMITPAAEGVPGQWDPFDDDDDIIKEPIPVIPNEAGPGPSVIPGTGVPSSLI
jgi:hypothetical protein